MPNSEFEKKLEIIKGKFVKNLVNELPVIEDVSYLINDGENPTKEKIEELRIKVHKIAGSAKTFGFPELSKLSFDAEDYVNSFIKDEKKYSNKELKTKLDALTGEIRKVMSENKEVENIQDEKPTETEKETSANAKLILVIDDDELVFNLIESAFEKRNDIVFKHAKDGTEGLLKVKEKRPDLLLLDVNMPKMSGFEVLDILKKDNETKNLQVVMLTRRGEEENIIKGLSYGAVDYILKPFDLEELVKKVDTFLMKNELKILIADDDELIAELLKTKFNHNGYSVMLATNGKEALDIIKTQKPNIVLLDIMMPVIDGFAVLRKVKSDDEIKNIPIVFLSAKNQEENVVNGLKIGAYDYITKPISAEEVFTRVETILQRTNAK
ncbi:MAG TPA: response regulator [Rickettsiales bacterium]|nr:response regulator [Rickettsiales bacterium]